MASKKTVETRTKKPVSRTEYHHGDLRRALLDASMHLIETQGIESVTMREVAKMTGVSPAAPFRHFASRTALLTAVAEEAMDHLASTIETCVRDNPACDPLTQFRNIGVYFLRWAFEHPVHFRVISTRAAIDFEGSTIRQRHKIVRQNMSEIMKSAAAMGLLRPGNVDHYLIGGRALAYGLARMYTDGQFPSWGLKERNALKESTAILDQYIASIRA